MTQGDPRLVLGPDGSRLQFDGGQPVMDRGLENMALIALFTAPGWCGNTLLTDPIGSDFESAANQPITRTSINQVRNAAERALDYSEFGDVAVTVTNPNGYRLNVEILFRRTGGTLSLLRDNGFWFWQTTDPAYRKIKGS